MIGRIAESLKNGNCIVIASHVSPEADAIGATMALGLALESIGKQTCIYNASGVPRNLRALPRVDKVSSDLPPWKPDILAVLDCGDFDRIGKEAAKEFADVPLIINVDHHATNDGFGHLSWVEAESSSAGEIAVKLIDELGVDWTADMATWIFAAIVADTGSFHFSNTRPDTFATAGRMVSLGARPEVVAKSLYGNLPEANLNLLAMVLDTLEVDRTQKVASVRVTLDMLRKTGAGPDATEGFVEYPRMLEGVEVSMLLREISEGRYKASLRSKGSVDVAAVANSFGGGGHRQAAGFTLEGSYDEIRRKIVKALDEVARK